jgi:glyoxylase-like metal-dependent hydrolase (beta-lactamase superfamily II)
MLTFLNQCRDKVIVKVEKIIVGALSANCYILYNDNKDAIIVDPGDESAKIINFISYNNLIPKAIIATHAHFDHIGAISDLYDLYKIPIYLDKNDENLYKESSSHAKLFGFEISKLPSDVTFIDYSEKLFNELTILHTPGHSPGSISIYSEKDNFIITGDLIFKNSVGRADLFGGDFKVLKNSIRTQIFNKPDNCIIFPGHGPETTVIFEKENNPFVRQER